MILITNNRFVSFFCIFYCPHIAVCSRFLHYSLFYFFISLMSFVFCCFFCCFFCLFVFCFFVFLFVFFFFFLFFTFYIFIFFHNVLSIFVMYYPHP